MRDVRVHAIEVSRSASLLCAPPTNGYPEGVYTHEPIMCARASGLVRSGLVG